MPDNMRSIGQLGTVLFSWILSETEGRLANATLLACFYEDSGPLQDYLVSALEARDTPEARAVMEGLTPEEWAACTRRTLPWTNIWGFVALCLSLKAEREGEPPVMLVEDEAAKVWGQALDSARIRRLGSGKSHDPLFWQRTMERHWEDET